tara:strand:- start:3672 stop:4646 length:975 start_codon:yes stop_codon:yes gene_type:complete
MNFILKEMTYLRYFIPLTIAGNKKNIKSNYFISPSNKYNCPIRYENLIKQYSSAYNFGIHKLKDVSNVSGPTFMIEGNGLDHLDEKHKKIVITYMTDFVDSWKNYVDTADHILLPSEYIAKYYNCVSNKNLYLGSPKYDFLDTTSKNAIMNKWGLSSEKKLALVVAPRRRDANKINLEKIYLFLKKMNFNILVKTRGKDPVDPKFQGDKYFIDSCWYPHDTLELLKVSDLLINFGSTTIKEAAISRTPAIDFNIKPKNIRRGFDFLYDEPFCTVLDAGVEYNDFKLAIDNILALNLEEEYDIMREKYFFKDGSSERIVQEFCKA